MSRDALSPASASIARAATVYSQKLEEPTPPPPAVAPRRATSLAGKWRPAPSPSRRADGAAGGGVAAVRSTRASQQQPKPQQRSPSPVGDAPSSSAYPGGFPAAGGGYFVYIPPPPQTALPAGAGGGAPSSSASWGARGAIPSPPTSPPQPKSPPLGRPSTPTAALADSVSLGAPRSPPQGASTAAPGGALSPLALLEHLTLTQRPQLSADTQLQHSPHSPPQRHSLRRPSRTVRSAGSIPGRSRSQPPLVQHGREASPDAPASPTALALLHSPYLPHHHHHHHSGSSTLSPRSRGGLENAALASTLSTLGSGNSGPVTINISIAGADFAMAASAAAAAAATNNGGGFGTGGAGGGAGGLLPFLALMGQYSNSNKGGNLVSAPQTFAPSPAYTAAAALAKEGLAPLPLLPNDVVVPQAEREAEELESHPRATLDVPSPASPIAAMMPQARPFVHYRSVAEAADADVEEMLAGTGLGLSPEAAAARAAHPRHAAVSARHVYPTWFIYALVRAACEEVEAASAASASSSSGGSGGARGEGTNGASFWDPPPAAGVLSPVRSGLPSGAPVPPASSWATPHSVSLPAAWLWVLQLTRDLRHSASVAEAWLHEHSNSLGESALSPSAPPAVDSFASAAGINAAVVGYEPFGALVQEDHLLRLLRRLPTGHLSHSAAIVAKALFLRAALAGAGWGSLNYATATILRLHIQEEASARASTPEALLSIAARRGSVVFDGGASLAAAAAAEAIAAGAVSPKTTSAVFQEPLSPRAVAAAAAVAASTLLKAEEAILLVETALLEPVAVPSPASITSFLPGGVDALGGALGGAGVLPGLADAYIVTPGLMREVMALVAGGGRSASQQAPGAAASLLVSPSAGLYGGPLSPGGIAAFPSMASPLRQAQSMASPGGSVLSPSQAATAGMIQSPAGAASPGGNSGTAPAPGLYSFLGPAAWSALAYTRARTPSRPNLYTLLATSPSALSAHFAFVASCLSTAVAMPAILIKPSAVSDGDAAVASARAQFAEDTRRTFLASMAEAASAEVLSVVGHSLLRSALDSKQQQQQQQQSGSNAPSPSSPSAVPLPPGAVRFVFLLMDAAGRAPLTDPESGAPLLLRSAASLFEVETALGGLTRAGRRTLGASAAVAMQAGGASPTSAAEETLLSPT